MRLAALLAVAAAALAVASAGRTATQSGCPPRPPDTSRTITRPRWLSHAYVTEYFPVREAWFTGRLVAANGIGGRHRYDWLYGAHGVAMNGEGLGRDGRYYRFAGPYDDGWVNAAGRSTFGCWTGHWSAGLPARVAEPARARFSAGRSTFPFWKTVAVDRRLVPYGSRVFIPAYCRTPAHGWFTALDTGAAIVGAHFDVYRAPPKLLVLRSFHDQKVYVVPPGPRPARPPRC
jgi:3D (Asp-Asp-Asp) domain-containing protein